MRTWLGVAALLVCVIVVGCDSSPRDQYVDGVCVVYCDGTTVLTAPQDRVCMDTAATDLQEFEAVSEQVCAQMGAGDFPTCGLVICDCDLQWTGDECT